MSQPLLVLIVEDHAVVALAIEAELVQAGFRVATASSPEAAAASLRQETPAGAIVDLNLRTPLDGMAVAYELAASGVTVIVCSAYAPPELAGPAPPFAAYLRKPCPPGRLLAALREAMGPG